MISEEQRQQRRSFIGSSDAAAVLGLNVPGWANRRDVWVEKVLGTATLKPTKSMDLGNRFEGVIGEMALERIGTKATARNITRIADNGVMGANLDFAITLDGVTLPLEVKLAGQSDGWGEEQDGLDGVPIHYGVQVMHECVCMGVDRGFLGALLWDRREVRVYEIRPSAALLERLVAIETAFWRDYVEAKVEPPDDQPASVETLSRVLRMPGLSVDIDDGLVGAWRAASERRKAAERIEDEAKARVLAALGNAEGGVCGIGEVTYLSQTRKEYVCPASTFRVLRFKPTAAEKARMADEAKRAADELLARNAATAAKAGVA